MKHDLSLLSYDPDTFDATTPSTPATKTDTPRTAEETKNEEGEVDGEETAEAEGES